MMHHLTALRRAWGRLRRFGADRRGNVAILASVMLFPIALGFGMAIDYSTQSARQDRLQGAADAAALAAVTPNMMAASSTTAQSTAQQMWNAQSGQVGGVSALTGVVTVVDTKPTTGGTTRNVTVTFSGKSATFFSSLIGFNTLPVSGASTSTQSTTPYINIYVLVDNSQSMGIGSTQTDMNNLYSVTQSKNGTGCVFGCHVPDTSLNETYADETLAHNAGITLRIDSAKSAITTMINQASTQKMSSYVNFALYTMGGGDSSSGTLLNKISSLSNNYSSLLTSVANIDLETQSNQVIGDTDIEDSIAALQKQLPVANGNGSSAANPMNFVFIVTDGADDFDYVYGSNCEPPNYPSPPNGWRCGKALTDSTCVTLQTSANIGVIYTPYLPIYTNNIVKMGLYSSYLQIIQPFSSSISPNLQGCASNSSYYMVASDGPSIVSAMTQLFNQALETAHLTS